MASTYTRRKALTYGSALVGGIGAIPLAGCAGTGGEVTLRFSTPLTEDSIYGEFFRDFESRVTDRTDGISFESFYAGELGSPSELIQQVQAGDIDMSLTDPSGIWPQKGVVLSYPYIYEGSFEKLTRVTDVRTSDIVQDLHQDIIDESNTRILGNVIMGRRNVSTVETPVREPGDLEGLDLRSVGIPLYQEVAEGLGGTPTPVAPADIATSLSTGTIDAVQLPIPTYSSFGIEDTLGYMAETRHMIQHDPFLINVDTWNDLTQEQQDTMNEAVQEALSQHVTRAKQFERDALGSLSEAGVEMIGPGDGLRRDRFEERVMERLHDRWPDLEPLAEEIKNA